MQNEHSALADEIQISKLDNSDNTFKLLEDNSEITTFAFIHEKIADTKRQKEYEMLKDKIDSVESLFTAYGGYMSGHAETIIRAAERCGGDYKVLIGIAGNESGLGRIPYRLYNPYGYLNGVQYSSWEEALEFLSCRISEQFLAPCNNDLQCIINKYGGPETDHAKWIRNVTYFMNRL